MLHTFDEWSEWSGLSPLIRPVSCWCFAASLFRSLMNSQYGIELPRKLNLCPQKPFRPTPLPFSKRSQNLLVTHPSSRLIQNKIGPRLDDSQEKPPTWCFREILFISLRLQLNVLLCRVIRTIPSEKTRVTRLHKVTLIVLLVQNN